MPDLRPNSPAKWNGGQVRVSGWYVCPNCLRRWTVWKAGHDRWGMEAIGGRYKYTVRHEHYPTCPKPECLGVRLETVNA